MFRLSFLLVALMVITGGVFAQQWSMQNVSFTLENQPEYAGVVAWGDVDGDGHPDLFVGGQNGSASHLYLYNDGLFSDRSSDLLPANIVNVRKAEFVDYNRDGLLDLFVLTSDALGARLFKQSVNHEFVDMDIFASQSFETPVRSALWNDIDGNGTLDLVLSNGLTASAPVQVYTQDLSEFNAMRDNPFEGMTGVSAMTFLDFDNDGHSEIFFGGNGATGSHFYRYNGYTWDDWATRFGFSNKLGSRGAAWLDYDNDGYWDLFCTGDSHYTEMLNGGWHSRFNWLTPGITQELRDLAANGYEVHPVDANMDGWTDLLISKRQGEGLALLINQQGTGWMDKAPGLGIDNVLDGNYSCAWADFNGDGTPDLAVAEGDRGVFLYQNMLEITHEYIGVRLLDRVTNAPVINCNVKMDWQGCKQIGTTFPSVSASGGDGSILTLVNRTDVKAERMDLEVRWPNGMTSHYLTPTLHKNRINTFYQPSLVGGTAPTMTPDRLTTRVEQTVSPNPFNPTTNISFDLAEAANVELKVYNLMGQEVANLANGTLAAGNHRLTFDAAALPSGLYFSRLTVGGTTNMTRMLLMK
ncbi:MAG TPA: T9SS type A sorting domain-containing protein [bacterium]|jgi:hypothetical protein